MTRVTVVGATGQVGRQVCKLLLAESDFEIVACGRSGPRLDELGAELGPTYGARLEMAEIALGEDDKHLRGAIDGAEIVVGVTSRADHAPLIARTAAESGASYIGAYMSSRGKWAKLRALQGLCMEKGVSLVDDGGVHPGVPGALVRLAAARHGVKEAWVGGKFDLVWSTLDLASETIDDFLSEVRDADLSVYKNDQWVRGFRHSRSFDFGQPVGSANCIPMCMEEIRELPDSVDGLKSTGFFIAGFGTVVDYLVFPASAALGVVSQRTAGRLLWWGLKRFQPREQIGVVVLEATSRDGRDIRYSVNHADPYVLTVVPIVATILQIRNARRPGVWTQASFVEPEQFVVDLERLGIHVQLSE